MKEAETTKKARKPVKTFPLIQWVGWKGDIKRMKRATGETATTRAIEKYIKQTFVKEN